MKLPRGAPQVQEHCRYKVKLWRNKALVWHSARVRPSVQGGSAARGDRWVGQGR